MKYGSLLIVFSLFCSAALAEDYRVSGKVAEAMLYPGQAQLTLRAQVQVGAAGEHTIYLTRTRGYIDPRTLQVRGQGDFTLLSARLTQDFVPEAALPPSAKALKDSAEDLRGDLESLKAQRDVYGKEEEMLLLNRKVTGENTGLTSTLELQKALDYFRERMLVVKAKQQSLDERIRRAKDLYEATKAQLDQQLSNLKAPAEVIAVQIRTSKPGAVVVLASYLTDQANWSPSYDARSTEGKSNISLVLKAQVNQRTGQDWDRVRLQFSSGNPGLGAEKPTLPTLTVGYLEQRPIATMYRARMAAPTMAANAEAAPMMAKAQEAADAVVQTATMDDGGLGLLFTLEQPANVPSSEQDVTTLELRRQELTAPQRLACAPALDPDVFVVATIRDWGSQNLLPGPVQVFYDGVFTGESYLPASTAQDSLQLSLGRERKVLVRRQAMPTKESKNFLGGKRIQAYAFETTIVNNRKDAIVLRLEDRIPVSRNAEIEVEAQELSGATPDGEGMLRYDVPLAAGQTKKQGLRYTIRYPKDKAIEVR